MPEDGLPVSPIAVGGRKFTVDDLGRLMAAALGAEAGLYRVSFNFLITSSATTLPDQSKLPGLSFALESALLERQENGAAGAFEYIPELRAAQNVDRQPVAAKAPAAAKRARNDGRRAKVAK